MVGATGNIGSIVIIEMVNQIERWSTVLEEKKKKKEGEPIQVNVGKRNKHGPKKERQMSYFYNLYVKNQRQYKRWRTRWELRDLL